MTKRLNAKQLDEIERQLTRPNHWDNWPAVARRLLTELRATQAERYGTRPCAKCGGSGYYGGFYCLECSSAQIKSDQGLSSDDPELCSVCGKPLDLTKLYTHQDGTVQCIPF